MNKALLLIFVFGIVLRVVFLGKVQAPLFRDETALGYNAYSIWMTGRDEYGVPFPTVFRSFEVFFLPAYVYLSAPIVGLIGLSTFSTRLLSSLSGIFLLLIAYKVSIEIWGKRTAIFATLVLALAPWHIFYSRGAFEGNLALSFFAAGFLFWIYFVKYKKFKHFLISSLFFALSMYSYQSERLVVPVFAIFAFTIFYKYILRHAIKLLKWSVPAMVLLLPLLSLTLSPGGYHRAAGVSIFSVEIEPPGYSEEAGRVLNNSVYLRGKQIAGLYFSYFSPNNLFSVGDANLQRGVENVSVFFAWTFPFLYLGLYKTVKRRNINDKLLLVYTLASPLPAALTGDPFHTYRSLMLYFPLSLFIGLGISTVFRRKWFIPAGLFALSILFFIYNYAAITPVLRARSWDYGYKELMIELQKIEPDKKIVIYDRDTEGYIHYLFFNKIDPEVYHRAVLDYTPNLNYYYDDPSQLRPIEVDNFEFREIDWRVERGDKGTYFVFASALLPESEFASDPNVELVKEIFYPDGESAYRIVRVKDD